MSQSPASAARAPRMVAAVLLLLQALAWAPVRFVAAQTDITWTNINMPRYPMGESTTGIVKDAIGNPLLILVGHSDTKAHSGATQVLDINSGKWSIKSPRLHVSHHMAGATAGNKFYLIGGYEDGAPGKVQIYDPIKDKWTHGPNCPVVSGAGCGTALGNSIYYCGGLSNGDQTKGVPITSCARFDVDKNTWSRIASMPNAVHHPVMATDGKKIYVFGGRNSIANNAKKPVNFVQIYDPATNSWIASTQKGGPKPLPVGRGGMSNAVYLDGHFYIIGGETKCKYYGPCPNPKTGLTKKGVYGRIDRYNPVTDTWYRTNPGMAIPRHGAYPVVGPAPKGAGGKNVIYVCGGGIVQGLDDQRYCDYMTVL